MSYLNNIYRFHLEVETPLGQHYVADFYHPETIHKEFSPKDFGDVPKTAVLFGVLHDMKEEQERRKREWFAREIANELTQRIIKQIEKQYTHNGYQQ